MEERYHIYYCGDVLEGHDVAIVRVKLAKLFNADASTLDKLFSGTRQAVKRNCDKATALKYKQAMENAGAKPLISSAQDNASSATPVTTSAPDPTPARELTKAERIAAIAAGEPTSPLAAPAIRATTSSGDEAAFDLAEPGADVLRPEERRVVEPVAVDTSTMHLDETGVRLSEDPVPAPPAPDTSHLSMGSVGETIPNLPADEIPEQPDTSAIDLTPPGTDFSDCADTDPAPLDLDLSGIDLAPEGSDMLEDQYRSKSSAVAPSTDHLSLD
jgi:hypothetical protein